MNKFLPLVFLALFFVCNNGNAQQWTWYNSSNAALPSNDIFTLAIDANGTVFAGGSVGISSFQANSWSKISVDNNSSLSILKVATSTNNLWVGTEFNGLYGYKNSNWTNYDPNTAGYGVIGIGVTSTGDLYRLDKSSTFTKWNGSQWSTIAQPYQGTDLFVDSKDNIWILNDGINKYSGGTMQIWSASYLSGDPRHLIASGCYDMVEDKNGIFWFATNSGLLKFDGTTFSLISTANSAIPSNHLRCIKIDSKGTFWIGSADAGLFKFDGSNWVQYTTANSALASPIINDIIIDKTDRVWIANGYQANYSPHNGKGVFMLDPNQKIGGGNTPKAPTNMNVQVISENEVALSWQDNSDNESSFDLECSVGDSLHFQPIKATIANTTSFTDLTVTTGNNYYYKIRALNNDGYSVFSNTVQAFPKYCTVNKASYNSYANATKVSFGSIYNTPYNCTNGYYNYLNQSTNIFKGQTQILDIAFNRCSITTDPMISGAVFIDWNNDGDFTDPGELVYTNLSINGKGEFKVAITVPDFVIAGTSTRMRIRSQANATSISPCGYAEETQDYTLNIIDPGSNIKPLNLKTSTITSSTVGLEWLDNTFGEDNYIVERSTDGTNFNQIALLNANSAQYTDLSAKVNTTYYYRVSVKKGGGIVSSNALIVKTLPIGLIRQTTGDLGKNTGFSIGAYWSDVNSDGLYDIYDPGTTLYQNHNSIFNRSSTPLPAGGTAAFADFDNDGDQDVFISDNIYAGGTSAPGFYTNDGKGNFTSSPLIVPDGRINNCVWTDFDNDGFLDLYVSYIDLGYGKLYKNVGGKSFTMVQKFDNAQGYASFADYDNDGDDDLIVIGSNGAVVFDKQNGHFTRKTNSPFGFIPGNIVGYSWGDIDNDGDLDLFIANNSTGNSSVYLNQGGVFLNNPLTQIEGPTEGSAWADFDNDGFLDLFVSRFQKTNMIFKNTNGVFAAEPLSIFENEDYSIYPYENMPSMGAAVADYNNDGFPDLFVAISDGFPSRLYKNTTNSNNWATFKLKGTKSNKDGVGARVKIITNGKAQYRWLQSGTGFSAQNSLQVQFGLADATKIDSVIVNWPSGIKDVLTNVPSNQSITVVEGKPTAIITFAPILNAIYGDADIALTITSNNTNIPINYTIDNPQIATLNNGKIHILSAGTVNITASQAGDTTYSAATNVTRTLIIDSRPISIAANIASKVYGNTDSTLTYNIIKGNLVGNDAFTGTLTRDAGENAGVYNITQGTVALNNNYQLTFTGSILIIVKKPLTVTANDATWEYAKSSSFAVTYNGFANADDATRLTTQPTVTTTANVAAPVAGTYDLVPGGGVSANYSFNYVNGKLIVTLPASNFKISGTSVTCKGSNNGIITISPTSSLNYTAVVTGGNVNQTYHFNSTLAISSLAPATYHLCVSADNLPDNQQCSDVIITEPKDLAVYATVNKTVNTVTLALTGSDNYTIKINGTEYQTSSNSITLPLTTGSNKISVNTDKLCQGTFEQMIDLSGITAPYPNPFQSVLYVNLGEQVSAVATISIFNMADGRLLLSQKFNNQSGVVRLDVASLRTGVYTLNLIIDGKLSTFKIVKQ